MLLHGSSPKQRGKLTTSKSRQLPHFTRSLRKRATCVTALNVAFGASGGVGLGGQQRDVMAPLGRDAPSVAALLRDMADAVFRVVSSGLPAYFGTWIHAMFLAGLV